jgi:hypothetical protein
VPRVVGAIPEVGAERALVRAMLVERHYIDVVAERFGPDAFAHPHYRGIFSRLLAAPEADPATLSDGLDGAAVRTMQRLLESAPPDLLSEVNSSLDRLRGREIDRALAALDEELRSGPPDSRKDEINAEKVRLRRERENIVRVVDRVGKTRY